MSLNYRIRNRTKSSGQKGVATLMVALVILVILTVIVLASSGVALFEQRTATNENRQRLADQVAKYALDLGGEFLKANIVNLGSTEQSGWLSTNTLRWAQCSTVMDVNGDAPDNAGAPHPCMAEPNRVRRAKLYFYSFGGSTLLPYDSLVPAAGRITTVGGVFTSTATVRALLCRIDTTIIVSGSPQPGCELVPNAASQNRLAVTMISNAQIPGENAAAQAKETWASFSSVTSSSTVPLVASGYVDMTGTVTIVPDPDGAGFGLPVSVWSALDADVDKTGFGSAASISSCQLGDFLNKPYRDRGDPPTSEAELKTTCTTDNNACGCPAANLGGSDFLSGHIPASNPACCENVDILDVDGGKGSPNPIPDITFFPGASKDHIVGDAPNTTVSNASALSDDSLFEWVFGVPNESISTKAGGTGNTLTNCGVAGNENCAIWYLTSADQLNAEVVTCAQLNAINAEASGLYYVSDSPCSMPKQIGSPAASAIVVVTEDARLNSTLFYGMLFVRSNDRTAFFKGAGNSMVIGSVVVEGTTEVTGTMNIVYDPTVTGAPGKKLPRSTRMARVSGSWLDNNRGGF